MPKKPSSKTSASAAKQPARRKRAAKSAKAPSEGARLTLADQAAALADLAARRAAWPKPAADLLPLDRPKFSSDVTQVNEKNLEEALRVIVESLFILAGLVKRTRPAPGDKCTPFPDLEAYRRFWFDRAWHRLSSSVNHMRAALKGGDVDSLDCSIYLRDLYRFVWAIVVQIPREKPALLPAATMPQLGLFAARHIGTLMQCRADLIGETVAPPGDCIQAGFEPMEPEKTRLAAPANGKASPAAGDQAVESPSYSVPPAAEAVGPSDVVGSDASPDDGSSHSENFRNVVWHGEPYDFTPMQADCVAVLWAHSKRQVTAVNEELILKTANSSGTRLRDVFKSKNGMHPAWKKMIVPVQRGVYRLQKIPSKNPPKTQ